jgi:capsular polysaccharide biosynthesis protein
VELKRYMRAIMRRWWIVVGVALVTVLALSFLWPQSSSYETSGSYVVRPRSDPGDDPVRATEALNQGVEINATYARIARSEAVKDRALEQLAEDGITTEGLQVRSQVVPGTNILEIGATGSDRDAVAAYAEALGVAATDYLDDLGEVYVLRELDPPGDPKAVASSRLLTVLVGLTFGVLAGAVLAFVVEYLKEEDEPTAQGLWDRGTGLYSQEYFTSRLSQELSRCQVPPDLPTRVDPPLAPGQRPRRRRAGSPLVTVGRVTLSAGDPATNGAAPGLLDRRDVAQALLGRLRPQDVLAYLGDDSFGVLFPDMRIDGANDVLGSWVEHLAVREGTEGGPVHATVQTCECSADGLAGDEEVVRLAVAP